MVIEQSIAGCPGTRSISDDILIWSSSIEEMAERLDTLFKALDARNLKINPKKMRIWNNKADICRILFNRQRNIS